MDGRPKISKHLSNRIPDVFIQQRGGRDKEKKAQNNQKVKAVEQKKQETQIVKSKAKKSRNPFLPVRDWIMLSKDLENKINEARQGIDSSMISKYNFDENAFQLNKEKDKEKEKQELQKEAKIKYEDCLTLNILKKSQTSCLKKILHVPTFTIYYLRESLIDLSIDKSDLEQWIRKCNQQGNKQKYKVIPQKIIQLFWNIPESYYSTIYEYVQGTMFETTLENINSFPTLFIQNLILSHLRAEFQIYNSQLIIKRNKKAEIAYLPVYEQIQDMIPQERNFRQFLKFDSIEMNGSTVDMMKKKMSARLGLLVMISCFGNMLVDEDIGNILFSSGNECCLIHKFISQSSLIGIFVEENLRKVQGREKEGDLLIDFLCQSLKFDPKKRADLSELRKHKFLRTEFSSSICEIIEIMNVIESTGATSHSARSNPSRELSLHKMNKTFDSMVLILQGITEIPNVNINLQNQNIRYFIRELGLGMSEEEITMAFNHMSGKLRRIYSHNS